MKKISLLFLILCSIAQAQEKEEVQFEIDRKHGIDPFVSFVSIGASNVLGGISQSSKYAGVLYLGLNFDLENILGWNGTRAKLSMINRHGKRLSNEVGSVFEPLNVVGGQSTFLYDISLEKDFGKHITLKALVPSESLQDSEAVITHHQTPQQTR